MKILLELFKLRKRSIIFILVLAVLDIALYSFISYSQQPRLETLQKKWFEKRMSGGVNIDKTLIYTQGKKDLGAFYSKIPPKKDFIRVMGALFELASNNGLKVGGVGYKPEMLKGRDILDYSLAFSVKGSYAAIKSFISDVDRSPEIVAIDSISLKNAAPGDAVEFSVKISSYFRVEKP